jgi:branched-chain amino acid transport system ATP-binding protein
MALGIASRVYGLETGKIILHGKASDLANNYEIRKAYLED